MSDPEATAPPVPARRATDLPPDAPAWMRYLAANAAYIHKEFSTWFLWMIGLLAAAAEIMPLWVPEAKEYLSGPTLHWVIIACAAAGFVSKYIKQKGMP